MKVADLLSMWWALTLKWILDCLAHRALVKGRDMGDAMRAMLAGAEKIMHACSLAPSAGKCVCVCVSVIRDSMSPNGTTGA